MIPIVIEAALRSLFFGLAVAVGLRMFRVRNVPAQKAAWGLVLVSAFAMPVLLPVTAQWNLLPARVNVALPAHPMTLLEELQARIQAKSGLEGNFAPLPAPIPQNDSPKIQESPTPQHAAAPPANETRSRTERTNQAAMPEQDAAFIPERSASSSAQSTAYSASRMQESQSPTSIWHITASPIIMAFTLYCGIAALFTVRLALALFTTMRLWGTAAPVPAHELPHDAVSLQVRASSEVASPFTIGSGILLPADRATWDSGRLRIVLARERSHVCQGDFYLQQLACLYAALVWPNPLGCWLKHELAELAEAISDRAAMEEAASRTACAEILFEFAAQPRRISIGVAMVRPGSLSRRIERLLNDSVFRQCFAGGRRALVVAALAPLVLFASTLLVRVGAASDMQSPSPATAAAPGALASPAFPVAPQFETLHAASAAHAIELGDQTLPQLPVGTPAFPAILSELKAPASEPAAELGAPYLRLRSAWRPASLWPQAAFRKVNSCPSIVRFL